MLAHLPMLCRRFNNKLLRYILINNDGLNSKDATPVKYFFALIWQIEKFIYI